MKKYIAPKLLVDEFVPDTMIASEEEDLGPKNGNAANNQNCWGCNTVAGQPDPSNPDNACLGLDYPFC